MILIGVGANLPSEVGAPRETCAAALEMLAAEGVEITAVSPWYETAPVPVSDQPNYVNGVACLETGLAPRQLLALLLSVEMRFGRTRSVANAARTIDLDLLAYNDRIIQEPGLAVPHPRLAERAFVLLPLRDLLQVLRDRGLPGGADAWCHPVSKATVEEMIGRLGDINGIRRLS